MFKKKGKEKKTGKHPNVSKSSSNLGTILCDFIPGDELVVLYDRKPTRTITSQGDIDIGLTKGEHLIFIKSLPNQWIRVVNQTTGQLGLVPVSFVAKHIKQENSNEEMSPKEAAPAINVHRKLTRKISMRKLVQKENEKYVEPGLEKPELPPINKLFDRSSFSLKEFPKEAFENHYLETILLHRNQISSLPSQILVFTELQILDLAYNRLTSLPLDIIHLVKLTQLNLCGNKLRHLPSNLKTLTNLTQLDLSQNQLNEIPLSISSLPNLRHLRFFHNSISKLNGLSNLSQLTYLNLNENQISNIDSLTCLTNLQNLKLKFNQLSSLPDTIGSLSALQKFYISFNQLSQLPPSFQQLTNLTKLSMVGNQLSSLNESLFENMNHLSLLFLQKNQIASLPSSFYKTTSLVKVNLQQNLLKEISPSIKNFTNCQELLLGFNQISVIPEELNFLTALTSLNLSHNPFSKLPSLSNLKKLSQLFLAYNNLDQLNFQTSDFPVVEEIFISGNPITQLPDSIFSFTELTELYACNVGLTELSSFITQLKNLQRIDLSHNQLKTVPNLTSFDILESLNLSHNHLTAFDQQVPEYDIWIQLLEFDLSFNQITELHPDFISSLKRHGTVMRLDGNPLSFSEEFTYSPSGKFNFGFAEMIGRRPTMEDTFILQGCFTKNSNLDLFGLFDGHSGNFAATFSAEETKNILEESLKQPQYNLPDIIQSLFPSVNKNFKQILATKSANVQNSGTTALIILVQDSICYLANLGDTRAVLCRENKALRISKDHKPIDEEDRVQSLGGYISGKSTKRINGMLAVSRSIGDFHMDPFVRDEPFVNIFPFTDKDDFIIIACDGVWDELEDNQATEIVALESDPFLAASKLRDASYLAGSDDNISVIIARLEKSKFTFTSKEDLQNSGNSLKLSEGKSESRESEENEMKRKERRQRRENLQSKLNLIEDKEKNLTSRRTKREESRRNSFSEQEIK